MNSFYQKRPSNSRYFTKFLNFLAKRFTHNYHNQIFTGGQ